MPKFNTTIRMGASSWTVEVPGAKFDLYAMNRDERRTFQHTFMDAYRAAVGAEPHPALKRRKQSRRPRHVRAAA